MNNFYLNENSSKSIATKLQHKDDNVSDELINLCQLCPVAGLVFIYNEKLIDAYVDLILSSPTKKNLTFYCFIKKKFPQFWQRIQSLRKIEISSSLRGQLIREAENLVSSVQFKSAYDDLDIVVAQFFEILCIRDFFKQKLKINDLTKTILNLDDKGDLYRQYCINFLKKEAQDFSQYKIFLCCRFVYTLKDVIQSAQNDVQQFKKYYWPISNENLINHLKKTVVSFLNRRGGIIYIGLEQDKTKSVTIDGVYLRVEQRIHLIQFIKSKVIGEVYPKFTYQKSQQEIQYHNNALKYLIKKTSFEYYFNKYISIDFLPIIDKKTLLNVKDVYLVRIKVKPGDQKQFYHLISTRIPQTPQFYIRQDKSVKKKNLIEGLNEFGMRLNAVQPNRQFFKPYHVDCKFELTPHEFNPNNITKINEQIVASKIRKSVLSTGIFSKMSSKMKMEQHIEQQQQQREYFWP